jgi:hypothetical protein
MPTGPHCSSLSNFRSTGKTRFRSEHCKIFMRKAGRELRNHGCRRSVNSAAQQRRRIFMKKTLAVLATVAAIGAAAVTAPAPAEARGLGPGLAFGLAAGAITAGALAATSPYYYGPGYYGYYGPSYAYGPGPYAYYEGPVYGGPVYYHHYYHHYRNW